MVPEEGHDWLKNIAFKIWLMNINIAWRVFYIVRLIGLLVFAQFPASWTSKWLD